jgi:hypothetical protein
MDDWAGLRTAMAIIVWVTVAGGLTMAVIWVASGGGRAVGPETDVSARAGVPVTTANRAVTSFSAAQVAIHGLLGVLTAGLVTYAALRHDDRTAGYLALVIALVVTAIPGVLMVRKWLTGQRPAVVDGVPARSAPERVEDHLPRAVVYLHGLAAVGTAALVVLLLLLD